MPVAGFVIGTLLTKQNLKSKYNFTPNCKIIGSSSVLDTRVVQIKYQDYINAKTFEKLTDPPMAGEYQMRAA